MFKQEFFIYFFFNILIVKKITIFVHYETNKSTKYIKRSRSFFVRIEENESIKFLAFIQLACKSSFLDSLNNSTSSSHKFSYVIFVILRLHNYNWFAEKVREIMRNETES